MLVQALANQPNREVSLPPQEPLPVTKVQYFMRMNLPEYYGSKVDENPGEFIDWHI